MNSFAPHGDFVVKWKDKVLVVEYHGLFNRPGFERLFASVQNAIDKNPADQWALIIDTTRWGGSYNDVLSLYPTRFDALIELGLVRCMGVRGMASRVLSESFWQHARQRLPIDFAETQCLALEKLAEHGFWQTEESLTQSAKDGSEPACSHS